MSLRRRSIGMKPWLSRCFCAGAVLAWSPDWRCFCTGAVLAWSPGCGDVSAQAQYWHDPLAEEMFLRKRSIGMIPWLRRCFCAGAVLAWSPGWGDVSAQAQYWHDPLAEETFVENSLFLADINNQGKFKGTLFTHHRKNKVQCHYNWNWNSWPL